MNAIFVEEDFNGTRNEIKNIDDEEVETHYKSFSN